MQRRGAILARLLTLPTPVDPLEATLDLGVTVLDMPASQKQVVVKRNLPATIASACPRSLVLQMPIAIAAMTGLLACLLIPPTPLDPLKVALDLGVTVLDMPARQKRNLPATIALAHPKSLFLQLITVAAMLACLLMLPTPVDPLKVTLDLGVAVLDMPARQKQVAVKRNLPATIALALPISLILQSPIAMVAMANFLQRSNKVKRKPSSVNQRRGENGDALSHCRLDLSPADPLEAVLAPSVKLPIARQSQKGSQNLVAKDQHL